MVVKHKIRQLVQMVPGKKHFGVYRFLPFFFILGGAMEWFMINVRIGRETFCKCQRIVIWIILYLLAASNMIMGREPALMDLVLVF